MGARKQHRLTQVRVRYEADRHAASKLAECYERLLGHDPATEPDETSVHEACVRDCEQLVLTEVQR